jgi:hypothetical protein
MSLKKFLKCQKENCEHLFPQKKLENERKIYIKTRDKKCGKETNIKQQTNSKKTNVKRLTKCFLKTLFNSKYKKMLEEKSNCGLEKCKNEHDIFLKEFMKVTKSKAKVNKNKKISRSRRRKNNSRKKRRIQKGSGWGTWVCPAGNPNPNYTRVERVPLLNEMGNYNPYV